MRDSQVRAVLEMYRNKLSVLMHTAQSPMNWNDIRHLLHMCKEATHYLMDNREQKAHRWLGFIQGALWRMDVFTINEMRKHNSRAIG